MRAIVERFVNGINDAGIPWCHWKSNEHVGAGLDANTDLDLLFPENRRLEVEAVLKDTGYLEFKTPTHRTYPQIADFLGLAAETGQLVHLQCHYALTLGEEHLKSYILPWASEILSRRVPWEENGVVSTAEPADELLLLILRGALKLRWRDRLRYRRGRPFGGDDFEREFSWLKARVGAEELRARALGLLGERHATRIALIYSEGATTENMKPAARELLPFARERGWRRMSASTALRIRWYHEFIEVLAGVQRSFGIRLGWILRRRVPDGGGAIIPLLGVDGSGKSSVTRRILKDWQNKIDIELVYFGTGDGPRSLLFRIASLVGRPFKSRRHGQERAEVDFTVTSLKGVLRAVLTARQKRKDMRWALDLRARGVIVICDRYPQNQITGFNDGPRLTSFVESRSILRRWSANYETRVFQELAKTAPDTAIRLKPSIDVASRRENGETPREILQRKLDEIMRLQFPASTPTPVVDADMPFDAVVVEVKRHIWKAISV